MGLQIHFINSKALTAWSVLLAWSLPSYMPPQILVYIKPLISTTSTYVLSKNLSSWAS